MYELFLHARAYVCHLCNVFITLSYLLAAVDRFGVSNIQILRPAVADELPLPLPLQQVCLRFLFLLQPSCTAIFCEREERLMIL